MRLAVPCLLTFLCTAFFANGEPVSFQRDVAPVLHRRCATCHNEESSKGHYRLDSFARLQKPGDSDLPPVVAGKAAESELYRLLLEPNAEDRMPQKADALPAEEIALIKQWLDEGAVYDGGSPTRPLVELARATLIRPSPVTYARPIPVTALAFSPDGRRLATSGFYEVLIWNLENGSLEKRIGGMPERITALAWDAKRNVLAAAGGSPGQWGTVALIEPKADFRARLLGDFSETALAVAFSPDGSTVAVGGGDRAVHLYDAETGKEKRVLRQHADWVQSVAFSPDGTHLLTASRDRTARVLDIATGEVDATYAEHQTPLLTAAFVAEGTRVISVDRSRTVHEWDTSSGNKRATFGSFPGEVQFLVPFRSWLITAGSIPQITIEQTSDHRHLFTLLGHHDAVQSVALLSKRGLFATGSADGEVLLWDLNCGTWTHRFVASPQCAPGGEVTATR